MTELGFTYLLLAQPMRRSPFCLPGQKMAQPKREILEEIKMEIVSVDQLEDLIVKGEFAHGAGQAAWLKWRLLNERR